MNVTQCDNCRALGTSPPPPNWLALVQIGEQPTIIQAITGNCGAEMAGTFCTWRCVAEYASVRALVPEAGEGS